MTVRSIAHRALQNAIAPALAFALLTGVAQAVPQHRDDRRDNGRGQDFHFRDEDRGHFAPHYQKDISRWRNNPRRPHFERGQRIPPNYRFQPVPRSYYSQVPPPPPGYQYGYYDGYVVAYNPTSRIIADVLDLAAAATR